MEQLVTYFTQSGTPKTGLSVKVNIWDRNKKQVITNGSLVEIGGGFYMYNFDGYNPDKQYMYQFDGSATLATAERYKFGSNVLDSYTNKVTRGRTAAPITEYTPRFDEIKQLIDSKEFIQDDTQVLKAIKGIKIEKPETVDINTPLKELESKLLTSETVRSTIQEEIQSIPDNTGDIKKEVDSINNMLNIKIEKLNTKLSSIMERLSSIDNNLVEKQKEEDIEDIEEPEIDDGSIDYKGLKIKDLSVIN